jgi:hypothetical protein
LRIVGSVIFFHHDSCCEFNIGVFLLAAFEIFNVLVVDHSKLPLLYPMLTMPKAMQAMKVSKVRVQCEVAIKVKKAQKAGGAAPKAVKAVK